MSSLTHFDERGQAHMVDVAAKPATHRVAIATERIEMLPDTLAPDGGYEGGRSGYGAGSRVGKGALSGIYGWGGAAGTIGFVDRNAGLRAGLFTQYMPSMTYPLTDEFPAAIIKDLAVRGARQ